MDKDIRFDKYDRGFFRFSIQNRDLSKFPTPVLCYGFLNCNTIHHGWSDERMLKEVERRFKESRNFNSPIQITKVECGKTVNWINIVFYTELKAPRESSLRGLEKEITKLADFIWTLKASNKDINEMMSLGFDDKD